MAGTALAVGDILQLRAWTTLGEQAAVNTFHYLVTAATGAATTDLDAATVFSSLVNSSYKTLTSADTRFNGVQCNIISRTPLPIGQADVIDAGPGTDSNPAMGRQLCGLISWRTLFAGPAFRGRTYFPFPVTDEDAAGGKPTNGYIIGLTSFAGAVRGMVSILGALGGTASVQLVIYHRATKTTTPIVASHVDAAFATMKKRGSFGRPNVSPI